jgi:hypothetical protein
MSNRSKDPIQTKFVLDNLQAGCYVSAGDFKQPRINAICAFGLQFSDQFFVLPEFCLLHFLIPLPLD